MNQAPESKDTITHEITRSGSFRVKKILKRDEVRWGAVIDLLTTKHRVPYPAAARVLRKFFKKLDLLFNVLWFVRPQLSLEENRLAQAICEVHGSDIITISSERKIEAGTLWLHYEQLVQLTPGFGKGNENHGRCFAQIRVKAFRRTFLLQSAGQVIATQAGLFLFAVLTYVVFVGAFLSGLSSFLLLLQEPFSVIKAATRRFDIWLSLLCFLVGAAGIFGKAIRNILRDGRSRTREKTLA